MIKKAAFSLIIPALLLFTVCGGQQEIVPKIEIKDGVKFVHNDEPLWGDSPKIELKFVRQIGVFEGPDDNYMFFLPTDFAVDNEGNIYVLDMGNFRIQKFDKDCKYLATFGREGQGPSEFQGTIVGIEIDKSGNIWVADNTHLKSFILIMTPDGKELRRFPFDVQLRHIRLLKDGSIIKESLDDDYANNLLKVYDQNGNFVKGIGKAKEYDNNLTWSLRPFYYTFDNNDNVYIAFEKINIIEKYSPYNELVLKIDRKLNYDSNFKVEKRTIELPVMIDGERVMKKETIKSLKAKYISQAIAVDGKERIWVVTRQRQALKNENAFVQYSNGRPSRVEGNTDITETDMYILEVFDKEGILLTRFPITHFVDGMRIYGDRLFILDKLRTMCIFEYKIIDL